MRVPLTWLRELVDIELPVPDLARRLTMAGLEVEEIDHVGHNWAGITIARVADLQRHPRADSLNVLTLDAGGKSVTVVTAAQNLRVGDVVPWVAPGGRLPGGEIGEKTFQGITSQGMLCSGDELGISPDKDSIYLFEPEATVGQPVAEYLADTVLDIYITANRPDCMSMVGVAREVHALTGGTLHPIKIERPRGDVPVSQFAGVQIDDPIGCPRFTIGVVRGVSIRPSPPWLQRRLFLAGVRPISNVVDVTNYLMLEMGQPLHAFDRDQLPGGTLVARRARPGEKLTTLDGTPRTLTDQMLVVADTQRARSLAGIMGGEDSEISDSTVDVLLEGASWDRAMIRLTSSALNLSSEAGRRFGRGVDPELTVPTVSRAVQMVVELAGGTAADGLVDNYPGHQEPRVIHARPEQIDALLGAHYPRQQVVDVLTSLEFTVRDDGPTEHLVVTVPSHRRFDVEARADLAEEVARVVGYEVIPTGQLSGRVPARRSEGDAGYGEELRARRLLAAEGLQEVISYSLLDPARAEAFDWPRSVLLPVANPMSVEESVLRPSLLPSLLQLAAANARHHDRVQLFELARTWRGPVEPMPREERRTGFVLLGTRDTLHFTSSGASVDFFDAKGVLDRLCAAFGVTLRYAASENLPPLLHPGRAAVVSTDAGPIGFVGQLHPTAAAQAGLEGRTVLVAEVSFEALLGERAVVHRLAAPSRYPAAQRDLAVVVNESVPQERVAQVIADAAGGLLTQARLFDVYRGDQVGAGKKSLAYALTYQAADKTLSDAEVSTTHAAVTDALRRRLGGEIRGEEL